MIVEVPTRYGIIAVTDRDTHQYDWFRLSGMSIDYGEIQQVLALLAERPRGVALDVGASFGSWSLALAPHATTVFAFEPQSAVYDLLKRTIALNGTTNIEPLHRAVGEKPGLATILRPDLDAPDNFGGSVSLCDTPLGPTEEVRVVTLDQIFADQGDVSFIKIDVEGYEPHVLRGAARTIARCRPILAVERIHKNTDSPALEKQIIALGYAIVDEAMDWVCVPV